jgi:hypothetical protein
VPRKSADVASLLNGERQLNRLALAFRILPVMMIAEVPLRVTFPSGVLAPVAAPQHPAALNRQDPGNGRDIPWMGPSADQYREVLQFVCSPPDAPDLNVSEL